MSNTYATRLEIDSRWPLAAVVGGAAGLLRPIGVGALSTVGVDVGVLGMTLQPDLPLWWLVHLIYSFAFGGLYAAVVYRGRLRPLVDSPTTGLLVGAGYGLGLWVVNVLVMWEIVVAAVLPLLATGGSVTGPLVGHLVYGVVLGGAYPVARRYA